MRRTEEERLAIGERIAKREITVKEAMKEYNVSKASAEDYARNYKVLHGIPVKRIKPVIPPEDMQQVQSKTSFNSDIDEYMSMTKEELIKELVRSKANELRAKKGYEVKGDGANKEFVPLNNKNSKS